MTADGDRFVNSRDLKLTALEFNECITRHDTGCLSRLAADDHVFIDREGTTERSKERVKHIREELFN